MAQNPFSVSPEEMKRLRQTYQGRTTKPTDMRTFKVDARPRAKPQPKLEVAQRPSAGSTAQSMLGMLKGAPEGLADLAVSIPTAAYDYIRTSTPGEVASDIKSGVGRFADYFSSNPLEALVEMSPAGGAKDAGEMLREAALARDAGDEERAAQIEKFAVPMMLAAMVPGGRAAKGAERMAVREGVEAAEQALSVPVKGKKAALAVKGVPNPLHEVTLEFGPDVARRLDGLVDMDAPLSEWREAAQRLAAADVANAGARAPKPYSVRPAEVATDPRIESRKGELGKIENLELGVVPRVTDPAPEVSIFDYEGHPYITSMSDLAAAGDDLVSINDVQFRDPFSRRGGQGYMFDNPGSVWASERKPAERHVELAKRLQDQTGKEVLYLPWTMGPNAVRFSHMPRGIQYAYADAALDAADRNALASDIKAVLPDWRGFEDPEGADMFMRATGKARNELNTLLDRYRTRGGLGIGEATYAATDLDQIGAPLTTLRNVGVIDPRFAASPSSHHSYDYSIPGRGLGVLKEKNLGALALSPDVMQELGYATPFDFPVGVQPGTKSPLRAMQMKPQGGVLDYDVLRFIQRLQEENQ